MKRMKTALKILAILPCLIFLVSCDNILSDSQKSNSILTILKITGQTADGRKADFMESDVQDDATGNVYEDVGTATLEARLKEPESLGPGSSYMNRIIVNRYEVIYFSVDPPEVVPPAPFTGYMHTVIGINQSVDVSFILVMSTAKNAPPLAALKGTENSINMQATVTFYGEDMAGHPVQASGTITIHFADWPDD